MKRDNWKKGKCKKPIFSAERFLCVILGAIAGRSAICMGKMMRVMGLDFGSKTVGVAVSDSLLITAQGVEIIRREQENKLRRTLARIEELVKEYEVSRIVLGFPKMMNNTEGERCERTLEFKSMLERRTGLDVELRDERLTTVAADRAMIEAGIRRENRKKYVDQIAAVLILQGYLDAYKDKENN